MTDTPDPDKPITAARGFCAPPDPQWGLPDFMTSSRPVGRALGALPRISPTRGAIRFLIPPWPWELPDRGFGTYQPHLFPTWDRRQAHLTATIARWRRTATVTRRRLTDAAQVATGRADIHNPCYDDDGWDD